MHIHRPLPTPALTRLAGPARADTRYTSAAPCFTSPKGANNDALVACPQDAEISAFELQTILRRVLAKRKYPLLAHPSPRSVSCNVRGRGDPSPAQRRWLNRHSHSCLNTTVTTKEPDEGGSPRCDQKGRRFLESRGQRSHPGFHDLLAL